MFNACYNIIYTDRFYKGVFQFVSHIFSLCDRLLILFDINICVCCPGKPMVTEFIIYVLNSFGLIQHREKATHVLRYNLDLIMSYGFSMDNINIEDACFSDQKSIVFNVILSSSKCTVKNTGFYSCFIHSLLQISFQRCIKEMMSQP